MAKRFGLILSNKGEKKAPVADFSRPSIFGNDSDSDSNDSSGKIGLLGPGDTQKRQARLMQEKALKEDPTVFQYDELYDEIENQRQEAKKSKTAEERKPKYIKKLLETADKRKKEYERRVERQVQKEREEEGEKFKDKESFVTSAYKKKLEEMKMAEEEEKREAYLESIGDVTKQKDLDGFYRHIYEQKMARDSPKEEKDREEVDKSPERDIKSPEKTVKKERSYRKRKTSVDEAEPEAEETSLAKKAHLQSNIDADSDFSIDSSSDSEDDQEEKSKDDKEKKPEVAEKSTEETPKASKSEENPQKTSDDGPKVAEEAKDAKQEESKEPKKKEHVKEKKPKINIWAKRTVGAVFEAALQRYYERKAARSGG